MTMGDRIRPSRKADDQSDEAIPKGNTGIDPAEKGVRDAPAREASAPHIEEQALIDAPGS